MDKANNKIIEILYQSSQNYADKVAIHTKNEKITYRNFYKQISTFAEHFNIYKSVSNRPIGLFFDNSLEFLIGYYGLVKAGIPSMLLDFKMKDQELLTVIKDCNIGGILTHKQIEDRFLNIGYKNLFTHQEMACFQYTGQYTREYHESDFYGIVSCRFTSGTEGLPKCMTYSQDNVIAASRNWIDTIHMNYNDKVLCTANFTHGLAFNTSLLAPLSIGCEIFITNNMTPHSLFKQIKNNEITIFVAFPVLYNIMSETNIKNIYNLDSLRLCVSSGEVLHREIKKRFRENTGIQIADLYGTAETGLCILNTTLDNNSIGKAISGVQVTILDDKKDPADPNIVGQLTIKSPSMTKGYYNFPGLIQEKCHNGFYISGDNASMDSEGVIRLYGRQKNAINVGGKKIDAKEVEEALLSIEGIKEAAVFSEYDKKLSTEVLKAAIVSSKDINKFDLMKNLKIYLSDYKIPQHYIFLDKLPRNNNGKVLTDVLRIMGK